MILLKFLFLSILGLTCAFKVMNVNLFRGKEPNNDQIRKTAEQINDHGIDIVTIHDSGNGTDMDSLSKMLDGKWSGIKNSNGHLAIYTQHKILGHYENVSHGMNVKIMLDEIEISVWSMFLHWKDFGPYKAVNGRNVDMVLRGEYERNEYNGRIQNIADLLSNAEFDRQINNSHSIPVIVAGAFNTPSHQDWINSTKKQHYGYVIDWPVTKMLSEAAGMTDSFREVYPDPNAYPGNTWIRYHNGKASVSERISYIFYRGSSIKAVSSYTHKGTSQVKLNDEYKIDNMAVVTEFEKVASPHDILKGDSAVLSEDENSNKKICATCALKIMNFQLYGHSDNGPDHLRKIADSIKSVNPDILTLQRAHYWTEEPISSLVTLLGEGWSGVKQCNGLTAVYTRHEIIGQYNHVSHGMNLRIRLNGSALEISVWSMYLEYRGLVGNHPPENVLKIYEIARVHNIVELLKHHEFVQQINSDNIPVIVAGMFNTPSHLDWTEDTKGIHNGRVVDWPTTKLLSRAAGMTDSFRELYPDPVANPGNTYDFYSMEKETGNRIHKFDDRIHFIFYRGSLRPKSPFTFNTTSPLSSGSEYYQMGDVATEFEYTPHKYENKPSFFIDRAYSNITFAEVAECPMKIIR